MNTNLSHLPAGSPQLVVAHAKWRHGRGKRPSMTYRGERNPAKALQLALRDLAGPRRNARGQFIKRVAV